LFNIQALKVIFRYVFDLDEKIIVQARNGLEALEYVGDDLAWNRYKYTSF
jgi:hypothetical protein